MPREFGRNVRVAETIQRIAAPVIAGLARDHGWGMVTVTDVAVATDMTVATVFVSVLGKDDAAPVVAAMKPFMPQVRAAVARDLRLKKCPTLHVAEDRSIVRGARIAALLREGQAPGPDGD